jgi:glycosyltransferase involved in cell wall biosynthesis
MHMACIAPNTPTIKYLFKDNVNICLFENESYQSLYSTLEKMLMNEKIINYVAENLYNFVKSNYSDKITYGFYNKLFRE